MPGREVALGAIYAIADALIARAVKLALGASVYDPADSMEKCSFNILATFAEFEADLIRPRTREAWPSPVPRRCHHVSLRFPCRDGIDKHGLHKQCG